MYGVMALHIFAIGLADYNDLQVTPWTIALLSEIYPLTGS